MRLEPERGKSSLSSFWPVIVFCLAGLILPVRAEPVPRVTIVLSDSSATYREVANAFVAALAGRYPSQVRVIGELSPGEIGALHADKSLIVPVGVRAMREVYDVPGGTAPILTLLAPRVAARSLSDAGVRDSAVYIDQSPARSLAFAKLLLPHAKKVGVIVSDEAASGLRSLAAEAQRAKLELLTETVGSAQDIPRALQYLLPQIDALLLVPDSEVVNENTVRHILIASYRQRIPVLGFSRGLTNAGAVASLVSSPAGIGRQGGLLARQWNPATGTLPTARYAGDFDMVFNRQVTRSLGIEVPTDERQLAVWRAGLE